MLYQRRVPCVSAIDFSCILIPGNRNIFLRTFYVRIGIYAEPLNCERYGQEIEDTLPVFLFRFGGFDLPDVLPVYGSQGLCHRDTGDL